MTEHWNIVDEDPQPWWISLSCGSDGCDCVPLDTPIPLAPAEWCYAR